MAFSTDWYAETPDPNHITYELTTTTHRDDELAIDNFCGGGGASAGIEAALGLPIDIAVNHDTDAIRMHLANHPETKHYRESVWDIDPVKACQGRPVGFAWFSPDCTHFSRAKGGKPRKQGIRMLAEVVHRWAETVMPRVIMLENVAEFEGWGPLDGDGQPIKERAGETFRAWVAKLEATGYAVEWRMLTAADYGAPTTRRRLFLIARCDGEAIVWPEATHGTGRDHAHRTAAECIDWSIDCPSIFDRKKPLADKTLRRIAEGIRRFVVETDEPFLVGDDGQVMVPTLIQTGYGERPTQKPRVPGLGKPLGTIVAGGGKHAVVATFLAKHYTGVIGHGPDRPLGTVTAKDHHSVVEATLEPRGEDRQEVAAFMLKYYGTATAQDLAEPLHTITAKARFGLVTIAGVDHRITDIGMRMLAPRELYNAQGFDDTYQIDQDAEGQPFTKTAQTRMCGNSVSPVMAQALVAANVTLKRQAAPALEGVAEAA